MRGSFRIGRIMGIDIMLDLSWFLIVALMVYTLGFYEFPRLLHPIGRARADFVSVALGLVVSLLLFASVLAHELSHSWMALQRGIAVKRITLFIFGGIAQIAEEPDRPSTEFLIAVMGPLMSLALAAIFGGAWLWLKILDSLNWVSWALTPWIVLCAMLAQVNGSLALFNLAPGFPLDGGRIFRAILWNAFHSLRRATRWATRAGQIIAILLALYGGWQFLVESDGGGLWMGLISIFIWNAANDGYHQATLLESLRAVTVGQLMTRVIETVQADISVAEFVDRHLLTRRNQSFVVSDGIVSIGLIALENVRTIKREEWSFRHVRDVMTPLTQIQPLTPEQNTAKALARLTASNIAELPVVADGQIVGFLGEEELSRYLKLKPETTKN